MPRIPVNIHYFGEVDSTMNVAKELINKAIVEGALCKPFGVVAQVQMKGRGSGGRTWISPRGNLYFTLCVPSNNKCFCNQNLICVMSLICGLACQRAMSKLLPSAPPHAIKTKWPNDIIYDHRKIGGTIVESEQNYLMMGMGMNIATAPTITDSGRLPITLNEVAHMLRMPVTITPPQLAEAIWDAFFDIVLDPEMTRAKVIAEFESVMDFSLKLHRRLQDGRDLEELTAVKLNEWGHLTVRHNDGTEEILAAEYLF